MLHLYDQIQESVAAIRKKWTGKAHAGIILGTGLGALAREIEAEATIPYGDIPHFAQSTATSHAGVLVCGKLAGVPVVAMEGRVHSYEAYPHQKITFPVRVMKYLGADMLIVSNACGGMNPQYRIGDVMVIDDHINMMNGNPLIGINDDRLGTRFPDMSRPYTPELIDRALEVARRENFVAHRGVFVAVSGPNLETRAELRFLRMIGADCVGMSTIPECIVAVHSSMRVLGLSAVTDLAFGDCLKPVDIKEILHGASLAEPKLRKIVLGVLEKESHAK